MSIIRETKGYLLWLSSLSAIVSCASVASDSKSQVLKLCPNIAAWEARARPGVHHEDETIVPTDRETQALLLGWESKDQEVRAAISYARENQQDVIKRMMEVDAKILLELKQLIANKGVPTRQQVGDKGIGAFWLLVQHAASDPDFQESILDFLKNDANGIEKAELAMLTDQVRVARGQSQIYGTQFRKVGNSFVAYEISQSESVDIRRAEHGLMPIADYECALNATYRKN